MFLVTFLTGFPFAELGGEFVDHLVNGRIEVGLGILAENIGPGEPKVRFHHEGLLFVLIVKKDNVRRQNLLTVPFQVGHFFRDECVYGTREGDISRTQVNVHDEILARTGLRCQQKSKNPKVCQ